MIGCSLIGTPDGFDSINAGLTKEIDIRAIVDLDNTRLNIFSGSELLMIKQQKIDGKIRTYYVLYRFAQEIDRNRTGSFYGSVVLLENAIADPDLILNALKDAADLIKTNCIRDNKFSKKLTGSGIRGLPPSVVELEDNTEKLASISLNKGQVKEAFFKLGNTENFKSYTELIKLINESNILDKLPIVYMSESNAILDDANSKHILSINPDLQTLNLEKQNEEAIRNQKIKKLEEENDFNRDRIKKLLISLASLESALQSEKANGEVKSSEFNNKTSALEQLNNSKDIKINTLTNNNQALQSTINKFEQAYKKGDLTGNDETLEKLFNNVVKNNQPIIPDNPILADPNKPTSKGWIAKIDEWLPNPSNNKFNKIAGNPIFLLMGAAIVSAVIYNLMPRQDGKAVAAQKKKEVELLAAQKEKDKIDNLSKTVIIPPNLTQDCNWIQDKNNRGTVHYRGSRNSVKSVWSAVLSNLDNKQGLEACELDIKNDMYNWNLNNIELDKETINDKKTNGIRDIIIHVPLNCIPSGLGTNEVVVNDEGIKKKINDEIVVVSAKPNNPKQKAKPQTKSVTPTDRYEICDQCNGSAKEGEKTCSKCVGKGRLKMAN